MQRSKSKLLACTFCAVPAQFIYPQVYSIPLAMHHGQQGCNCESKVCWGQNDPVKPMQLTLLLLQHGGHHNTFNA